MVSLVCARTVEKNVMTRRALFGLPLLLLGRRAEAAGFHISGKITATFQEAQEGYFAMGRDLTIATRPGRPLHKELQAMVGQECQVSVFTLKAQ